MKRRWLKFIAFMFLAIPCTILFGACKDKSSAEPNVLSISVELVSEEGVDFVSDTNTLRVEYGSEVPSAKEDFKVIANYSDQTAGDVSDYVIDLSEVENNPDVGTYKIEFSYAGKSAKINIEIYPKKITKPTLDVNQIIYFQEDTISDMILSQSPETTYDENTMIIVDGSICSATDVGNYQLKVKPNQNHIWETYDDNDREEVVIDWKIERSTMYASKINSLLFAYEEDVEHTITFDLSREQFIPFDEFFEVSGTLSATEIGEYSFVVKLKEDKKKNYKFFEIYRVEGVDFEYNADMTEITYFWEIVA